jgi:hypothetical protein
LLNKRIIRAVLAILGACVLVLLARSIGVSNLLTMLRRVGWGFWIVVVLYGLHTALRGVALWLTLDDALPVGQVVRIRFGTEGVEMLTLTGPFVAEPAKGWLLHRAGLDPARAFGTVAAEYLLYNLTAAWMAAASLELLLWQGLLPSSLDWPAKAIIVAVLLLTTGTLIASVTGVGLIAPAIRATAGAVAPRQTSLLLERVVPVETVLVAILHERPARLAAVIGVEVAGHALLALEIWVVTAFLGFSIPITAPLIVEGAVKFIGTLFFFVPGQLGVNEGAYALLITAIGLPPAAGVTLALVRRARALVIGGIGFAWLMSRRSAPDLP